VKTVARESEKYDLDLVGVQQTRWDKGGTEEADDHTVFYGREYLKTKLMSFKQTVRTKILETSTEV
jgi:hypothetical protein